MRYKKYNIVFVCVIFCAQAMEVSIDRVTSKNLAAEEDVFNKAFTASYNQLPVLLEQISKKYPTLDAFLHAAFEDENVDFHACKPATYFLNAKIGDNIVGYMSFDIMANDSVYIRILAIDPAYTKKSIGRMLVFSIFKFHPTTTNILLITRRANTSAIEFYQHLGFKITGFTHEGYDPAVYVGMEFVKE